MKLSKFDIKPACEESADFVPSRNDEIDSLPPELLEASYYRPASAGQMLWDAFAPRRRASDRNAILRDEADIRGEAFLMAD